MVIGNGIEGCTLIYGLKVAQPEEVLCTEVIRLGITDTKLLEGFFEKGAIKFQLCRIINLARSFLSTTKFML